MVAAAILFLVLGILIKYGKMYFLIAGYNKMSKEDKANYDIEGIATLFRNAMFGMAFFMLLGYGAGKWMEDPRIEHYIGIPAIIIGVIFLIVRSNSGKYKVRKDPSD